MKKAIQQAQKKVLSPIECAGKTVEEVISEPDGPMRIVITKKYWRKPQKFCGQVTKSCWWMPWYQ